MNDQIHKELESAYLYLAMSAWFSGSNHPGAAVVDAGPGAGGSGPRDEVHRLRGGPRRGHRARGRSTAPPATLKPRRSPRSKPPRSTRRWCRPASTPLYELAAKEKDYATQALLQWFITEQVEEEKTSRQIVDTLRLIGTNTSGLYMFDRELGRRGQAG